MICFEIPYPYYVFVLTFLYLSDFSSSLCILRQARTSYSSLPFIQSPGVSFGGL